MDIIRKHYGTIELGSKVVLSDPCYDADIWCSAEIINMMPGVYDCYADIALCGEWGTRVVRLVVIPAESNDDIIYDHEVPATLAVDAGVFGIYDSEYFCRHKKLDDEKWYNENVISWISKENAFICEEGKGFITESGYGDGCYCAYYSKNDRGQINSIEIVFIEPDYKDPDDYNIIDTVDAYTQVTKENFEK